MSDKVIRWGLIAPGEIAGKFAAAMKVVDNCNISIVGSRESDRAKAFADKFSMPQSGSYEDVYTSKEIDAIYIASPNTFHTEQSIRAMEHGKAVLCEKPLTVDVAQGVKMVETARSSGVFLMEALWTRTLPVINEAVKHVRQGQIGEIRRIEADFSFSIPKPPEHRINNGGLGGGALLDTGVYLLHLARLFSGQWPESITAMSQTGVTGVDEQTFILQKYSNHSVASLSCGISSEGRRDFRIIGSDGVLDIQSPWHAAQQVCIRNNSGERLLKNQFDKNGFEYQIREVNRCLRAGLTESPMVPLSDSLNVLRQMQLVRDLSGSPAAFSPVH